MRIEYVGPFAAVVTSDEVTFKNGEPVEVSDELGKALKRRDDFRELPAGKEAK